MADNIPITPGSGRTVATDQVGGIDYQRVKKVLGKDGTVVGDSDYGVDNTGTVPRERVIVAPFNVQIGISPTNTAGTYADGDCIGGLLVNGYAGSLATYNYPTMQAMVLDFECDSNPAFKVWWYTQNSFGPTLVDPGDGGPFGNAVPAASFSDLIAVTEVSGADYTETITLDNANVLKRGRIVLTDERILSQSAAYYLQPVVTSVGSQSITNGFFSGRAFLAFI